MISGVSLKGALAEQGFRGGTRGATEWNQWMEAEKQELSKVMGRYGIQWKKLGTHNKHLSVLDYKKQERAKEVAELDRRIEKSETALRSVNELVDSRLEHAENLSEINENLRKANDRFHMDNSRQENANAQAEQSHSCLSEKNCLLQAENESLQDENKKLQSSNSELERQKEKIQDELNTMGNFQAELEQRIGSYDEGRQWQLPEPGAFTSAKSYFENTAKPLVEKLRELVKSLTARCASLAEQVRRLTGKVKRQAVEIDWYKGKLMEQAGVVARVKEKAADLERVRQYAGADRAQEMIDSIKEAERLDREQKRIQRNYDRGYYR